MRSVALTNISSAANQGILNPNATSVANNMSLNVAAQSQISQIAADLIKTMASEKTISSEKRSEPSFDNQNTKKKGAENDKELISENDSAPELNGKLLAVA